MLKSVLDCVNELDSVLVEVTVVENDTLANCDRLRRSFDADIVVSTVLVCVTVPVKVAVRSAVLVADDDVVVDKVATSVMDPVPLRVSEKDDVLTVVRLTDALDFTDTVRDGDGEKDALPAFVADGESDGGLDIVDPLRVSDTVNDAVDDIDAVVEGERDTVR